MIRTTVCCRDGYWEKVHLRVLISGAFTGEGECQFHFGGDGRILIIDSDPGMTPGQVRDRLIEHIGRVHQSAVAGLLASPAPMGESDVLHRIRWLYGFMRQLKVLPEAQLDRNCLCLEVHC